MNWFDDNLESPFDYRLKPAWLANRSLCWFRSTAREHLSRAWEMAAILEAYVKKWNGDLQVELRVSENGAAKVAGATEGFSFAYLKELFVASMVQWMSDGRGRPMGDVLLAQTDQLREQMKLKKKTKKKRKD